MIWRATEEKYSDLVDFQESIRLNEFNTLPIREGLDMLHRVCASTEWGQQMLAARPFANIDDVLSHADRILTDLRDTEIDAARDAHARIGAPVDNASEAREQSGLADATRSVRERLAEGNRAYEEKFGYLYLVFASGRSGDELLTILTDRLGNDAETERPVMVSELGKINRLRLEQLLTDPITEESK
jgi:2-oxo-4-hydroxy-4-carboxy-5-ureidoimidazoline decarboxylase